MDRRNFLQRITVASASLGAAGAGAEGAHEVRFAVRGFTCVTCAVGLEVMLKQQPGVLRASASYPEGRVVIGFDSRATQAAVLRKFINQTTGFTVVEEPSAE